MKQNKNQEPETKMKYKLTFFLVSGSTKGGEAFDKGKSLRVDKKNSSQGANINIPCPSLPLRPVLPSRCIYCSLSDGSPTYNCTDHIVNHLHSNILEHTKYISSYIYASQFDSKGVPSPYLTF